MAESCEVLHSFSCSICLDVLKNPVTLHCGHNYCMDCINGCFDQEDQSGIYSCPQCRHTFNPRPTFNRRPVLKRNTILANLLEEHKKTTRQGTPGKDQMGNHRQSAGFRGQNGKADGSCRLYKSECYPQT
uniref:RING-type domain-containing protein n=1 Tax=Pundamilia nyererei TaxID=303518 RepID=A0A3B4H0M4_9CICH